MECKLGNITDDTAYYLCYTRSGITASNTTLHSSRTGLLSLPGLPSLQQARHSIATLTWTWYLLSQHPEVEQRLHDEVDRVLGGELPTVDRLGDLPYTRNVIQETLRLYPPAFFIIRHAIADNEIGPRYGLPLTLHPR